MYLRSLIITIIHFNCKAQFCQLYTRNRLKGGKTRKHEDENPKYKQKFHFSIKSAYFVKIF